MAKPVHFYTMNRQVKNLINRTYSRCLAVSSKEMYFIVTAADSRKQSMGRTREGFRGFTSCLEEQKRALFMESVPGIWETSKEAKQ
jgi:hypothetical protein